jgi:hypothetical protein
MVQPRAIVSGEADLLLNNSMLTIISISFLMGGLYLFRKRDLSL